MKYKHIVWDWNGTLLNDAEACAKAMSMILEKRNLGTVTTEDYRSQIEFPAIKMYEETGFQFENESFDDLSEEYIINYKNLFDSIKLHDDTLEVLQNFKKQGMIQHIVSASGLEILKKQVELYKLNEYFTHIFGQENNRGDSKVHLALKLLKYLDCNPKDVLFIGDTAHDYEVATKTGFDCRLVSNGHSSREKLEKTGALIYSNLTELYKDIAS
ncbi:MAG: HAD family hydrolase [Clostridiaceae bacterium]|nr:HAD family hydrolase [Clostridiaceae bacterium]